ncbi:hypothetical protein BCV69DRAFT_115098 [Microstroma glucosiphilum]|uniref:SGNH hydrolase n=1 Tax=Pseudomicrostroma glucosiphilum TaxID=1684307 RepID=A0A316UDP7_9BASI|nr:hypothetical protein BCV69DRAFT_115098 [Pseudomicrostroma glucosiphilum]PWN23292.1 hypothetical protein BCV69DRAFT_115098 [Pseudomicrostroma glucosiphilum]
MRLLYLRSLSFVAVGSLASLVTITASLSASGPAQSSAAEAAAVQGPHGSYSSIIVFGDSLSDDGSGAWELTKHAWPRDPAYDEGRFCNGLVWVEHLARWVGGTERPQMERGKERAGTRIPWLDDRAFGGATLDNARNQGRTGYRSDVPVPAVKDQVQRYLRERQGERLNDSTLFIVGGGGNE